MRRVITLVCLILSLNALAAPKAYFTHDGGWFALDKLQIADKTFSGGWSYYDIRDAVKSDPQALLYAEKHRKYALWGNWLMWGGLVLAITYLFGPAMNDGEFTGGEAGIYFGTFFAGWIPGTILLSKSRKYLHKAVNEFNGVKDKRVTFFRYNIRF